MANNGKLLAAVLLGAATGAVFGILFAPDKGSATRKKMAGKASELGDELRKGFNKSKVVVNDYKERMMGNTEEVKNSSHSRAY